MPTTGAVAAADVTADAMWLDDHWALTLHTPAGAMALALRMAVEIDPRASGVPSTKGVL